MAKKRKAQLRSRPTRWSWRWLEPASFSTNNSTLVPTKVIAVANQKGGVGKTTTSVNVAACLAANGQRILLLDLDPQANATSGLGLEKKEGASAYAALLGEGTLQERIQPTAYERLSIVPSEVDMCGAEVELSRLENHLHRLKGIITPVAASGEYDLILIDCPPA